MRFLGLPLAALLLAGCATAPVVDAPDRDRVVGRALEQAKEELSGPHAAEVFAVTQEWGGEFSGVGYNIRWGSANLRDRVHRLGDSERQIVERSREKGAPIFAICAVGYRRGEARMSHELAIFYEDIDGRAEEISVPYWREGDAVVFGEARVAPSEPYVFVYADRAIQLWYRPEVSQKSR